MTSVPPDTGITEHTKLDEVPVALLIRPWGVVKMQLVSVSLATNTFVNIIEWTAGTELARHHRGANEAAETRAIGTEENRHVTAQPFCSLVSSKQRTADSLRLTVSSATKTTLRRSAS